MSNRNDPTTGNRLYFVNDRIYKKPTHKQFIALQQLRTGQTLATEVQSRVLRMCISVGYRNAEIVYRECLNTNNSQIYSARGEKLKKKNYVLLSNYLKLLCISWMMARPIV